MRAEHWKVQLFAFKLLFLALTHRDAVNAWGHAYRAQTPAAIPRLGDSGAPQRLCPTSSPDLKAGSEVRFRALQATDRPTCLDKARVGRGWVVFVQPCSCAGSLCERLHLRGR